MIYSQNFDFYILVYLMEQNIKNNKNSDGIQNS